MRMLLLLLFVPLIHAETIQELADADHLRVRVWVAPEQPVATQQVMLNIEIAVDKWFTGGTRIGRFDIPGAIVLQREQLAVNSTRRERGTTWAVQLWQLTIYPQQPGAYRVPPIELKLKVAGHESFNVAGTLTTEPAEFTAVVPEPLTDVATWLATPGLRVTESWSRDDALLEPGDALVRTVRFEGEALASMMLPRLTADEIDGLEVYAKPPRLEDRSNRGSYLAIREDTLTYMMVRPGDYVLPALSFSWWDLEDEVVRTVDLPERVFTVEGELPVEAAPTEEVGAAEPDYRLWAGVLIAAIAAFVILRHIGRSTKQPARAHAEPTAKPPSERELRAAFRKACRRRDKAKALACLYRWLDHAHPRGYEGAVRAWLGSHEAEFDRLTESLFGAKPVSEPDLGRLADHLIAAATTSAQHAARAELDFRLNP